MKELMNYCKDRAYAQEVMTTVLHLGQLLVRYGVEIYRAEDTISRICESYENLTAIDVFDLSNGLFISLKHNNKAITMYKSASVGNLNLEKIDPLNTFSRRFVRNPQYIQVAIQELRGIEDKDEYSFPFKLLAAGLVAFFFSLLFGVDFMDATCTFLAGVFSCGGVFILSKYGLTLFTESFPGVFFSSFFAMTCIALGLGHNIDHIIIGSVMLSVSGAAITNAIRDIMSDDFLSGLMGLVKAIFIVLAIVIGVGIVLSFHLKQEDFMIYFKAFFYSFVASLGFALPFNAPRRSIVPARIVGEISWAVYEFLQARAYNCMLSASLAAFITGTSGEISSRKLKNPATPFILLGLIPLVSGAGMYYSTNQLIEQNYNSFIEIGAKTFFIAVALSVGIAALSTLSKSLRGVRTRK